jgi:hypothetical protein
VELLKVAFAADVDVNDACLRKVAKRRFETTQSAANMALFRLMHRSAKPDKFRKKTDSQNEAYVLVKIRW